LWGKESYKILWSEKKDLERRIKELSDLLENKGLLEKMKSALGLSGEVEDIESKIRDLKNRLNEIEKKISEIESLKKKREEIFQKFLNINIKRSINW